MKKLPEAAQSLIDAQDHPFVLIDAHYRIVAANKAYCRTYGVTLEEVTTQCCHEVSHHSPVPCHLKGLNCPHQQVFETGQTCEVTHDRYNESGDREHLRIKGHPIRSDGETLYLGETIFRLVPVHEINSNETRMIGNTAVFQTCLENLRIAAKSDIPTLLCGETGVGKELAANFIHRQSVRRAGPYVILNCATLPEALCESELFGHERGAFTGSEGLKRGLLELADGGTLFLDEIGELPLPIQPKLLRALDTGEFRRVGGRETRKADVRLISATHRDLLWMTATGGFREDLYYRIAGYKISIPPLRDRRSDIPDLAQALIAQTTQSKKDRRFNIAQNALDKLMAHNFPGNIRELRNVLQKAVVMASDGRIQAEHIHLDSESHARPERRRATVTVIEPKSYSIHPSVMASATASVVRAGDRRQTDRTREEPKSLLIAEVESRHIAELLMRHQGNRRTVARLLGISERTLYRKINRYKLRDKTATKSNSATPTRRKI